MNLLQRTISSISTGAVKSLQASLPCSSRWPVCPLSLNIVRSFSATTVALAPLPKKSTGAFKAGMTVQKKRIDVETDPYKLVNYLCGGQIMKEGPEIKLGPDSDYPDWLWTLNTGPPRTLSEMDPDTIEYWDMVNKFKRKQVNKVLKAAKGKKWLIRKVEGKRHLGLASQI